jgi:hypothetical protein
MRNNELITVMWRSCPTGWHIRSLDNGGNYTVELLSEVPPFRHLTSGCLFPWDKERVIALTQQIIANTDGPRVQQPSDTGFVAFKVLAGQAPPAYFFCPSNTENPQARRFQELVAILDRYFSAFNSMIQSRAELYEADSV